MNDNDLIHDVLDPIMLEYPFVRDGMTVGEYIEEKIYYGEHFQEYRRGKYKPLWKQREETIENQ